MEANDIFDRPAIEGLALAARSTVDECRQHGAGWTLVRIVEGRQWILAVMLVRRLAGLGIPYGKGLVGWATVERARALGEAIDPGDRDAAVTVLDAWMNGERPDNERLVAGLLEAFPGAPEMG